MVLKEVDLFVFGEVENPQFNSSFNWKQLIEFEFKNLFSFRFLMRHIFRFANVSTIVLVLNIVETTFKVEN